MDVLNGKCGICNRPLVGTATVLRIDGGYAHKPCIASESHKQWVTAGCPPKKK